MNNLSIVGRIGRVSELKYTQSGKAVINISVAVDNGKNADGEKRAATWFEVTLWEKQAEALTQYLVVGDRVGVNGQIRLVPVEEKGGQSYPAKLTVDFPRVELLGGSTPANTPGGNSQPQQRPAQQRNNQPTTRRQAPPAAQINDSDIGF